MPETLEKTGKSLLYKEGGHTHIPPPMIFIASTLLTISINLLLVVFVIVCLLMALLILMQRPKQEGLGAAFGGGVTDQVFGARTTNVLQKGTVYLGSMFFILSLTLAILIGKQTQQKTLLDGSKPAEKEEAAVKDAEKPIADAEAPAKEKSLAEELPAALVPPAAVPADAEAADAAADTAAEEVKEAVEETPAPDATEETPAPDASGETPAPSEPVPEENNADKPE